MIGARPEQIAFMRNTSDGLSTVANGLRWSSGDNLVTFVTSFRRNIYPGCVCGTTLSRGAHVRGTKRSN